MEVKDPVILICGCFKVARFSVFIGGIRKLRGSSGEGDKGNFDESGENLIMLL